MLLQRVGKAGCDLQYLEVQMFKNIYTHEENTKYTAHIYEQTSLQSWFTNQFYKVLTLIGV